MELTIVENGALFTAHHYRHSRVQSPRQLFGLPLDRINWTTSSFLAGTLALTLTAVPLYLWHYGLELFQILLFFIMLVACGFSVTLGYHRLFSHFAFQASWPVRLITLIFGAGAFENSALMWASEHRRHHKHVDHEHDPYSISKGFFHAHIGWLLFKIDAIPPYDNVADLQKDRLIMWQDKYIHWIAVLISFVLPAAVGYLWNGWVGALGAFLIGGVARVVVLQHCTFLINSACHTIGTQPYSTRCSARDSFLLAIFTFGEGYHNYHHEFQHDYRNGVKPWQIDPTKWIIWVLSKVGLARGLRRVSRDKIRAAEHNVRKRQVDCLSSVQQNVWSLSLKRKPLASCRKLTFTPGPARSTSAWANAPDILPSMKRKFWERDRPPRGMDRLEQSRKDRSPFGNVVTCPTDDRFSGAL